MANPFAKLTQSLTASAQPKRAVTRQALVSSAKVSPIGDTGELQAKRSVGVVAWQKQAWTYFDTVGELHYSASFVGACLSRCSLTIGVPDDDGHVGPAFDEDGKPLPGMETAPEALEYIRALKSDVGGQSQLLRLMGINLAVVGDLHLVGSSRDGESIGTDVLGNKLPTDLRELQWEALSTEEFQRIGDGYRRQVAPGASPIDYAEEDIHVIRIWRAHPRWSDIPDCSTVAVLDVLEELVLLTREVRGEALSRLSNGKLLLMPDEIEWPGDDNNEDDGDTFVADLVETLNAPIRDKGSASAVAPFVIRGPADLLHPDKLRTLDLARTNPSDSAAKRAEAVMRFAQGVDLPVEIVTGHAGTTFSNAVQISDDVFKSHIEPLLELITDSLTTGFLIPAMGPDCPFVVHFDSSELVSRPNRAADAKDVHDRFALSDATLRNATGFSDSDAPDEEEIAKRIAIKAATRTNPFGGGAQGSTSVDDIMKGLGPSAPTNDGAPINQGPLDGNTEAVTPVRVAAAAEMAIERGLARAGARLRSLAAKEPSLRDVINRTPDVEVCAVLGPQAVARLTRGSDPLSGEFESLRAVVARWTQDVDLSVRVRDACMAVTAELLFKPNARIPIERVNDVAYGLQPV